MTEEFPKGMKTELAIAIAQGKSVALWARDHRVPKSTAYYWANDPKVRRVVESCRRRTLDRAIGRMARRATWASDQIAMLAKMAESESVKLRALRSIFSDVVAVSRFSDLEYRMAEIEEGLRDPTDDAGLRDRPDDADVSSGHPQPR